MTDLLAQRFARVEETIDDADWLDVRRRARRPQRRRVGLVAALAAAVALLVTPTFGLGSRLLDLIQGRPAPHPVQAYFAADDALRRQLFAYADTAGRQLGDRYSAVDPQDARGIAAIESADGPIYLWAAPTQDGRQCWLIQAGADPATQRPYGFGACDDASSGRDPLVWERYWTQERPSVQIVHARVYDDAIRRIRIDVAGGAGLSVPVISGHALGTVPLGTQIEAVKGIDADGTVVARARIR